MSWFCHFLVLYSILVCHLEITISTPLAELFQGSRGLMYVSVVCKLSRAMGKGGCITTVFWTRLRVVPCPRDWEGGAGLRDERAENVRECGRGTSCYQRRSFYHQKKALPFLSTVSTLRELAMIKTEDSGEGGAPLRWTHITYLV